MDRLPVVFSVPNYYGTKRMALNISTKQFCTIDLPMFEQASCMYSKDGWLLLLLHHRQFGSGRLVLLNPITGARFDLPEIYNGGPGPFSFSTNSGVPDRVIHLSIPSKGIVIHMIRPGDEAWKEEVTACEEFSVKSAVTLVGMQVLCIDRIEGRIVTFDLSEGSWSFFSHRNKPRGGSRYIVDDGEGGEILRVCCPFPSFSSFSFSKLDLRRIDWVEMDDFELENTSWFLGHERSFRVKEEGKKVYTLLPKRSEEVRLQALRMRTFGADIESNVYIHNLADGSYQSLLPDSFLAKSVQWASIDVSS